MDKLTDLKCRKVKCNNQRLLKVCDGNGLYLWIYKNGKKFWNFRYKLNKVQKDLRIGSYPNVGLQDARNKINNFRILLAEGIDPSLAKKDASSAASKNTFELVAREWYSLQKYNWSVKHAQDVLRRLEVNIFPYIGNRVISTISGPDLGHWHASRLQFGEHYAGVCH